MLTVGLTGGIGAGKGEVARLLAGYGAVVVDADALAREALAPGTPGLAQVVEEFGEGVLAADGSLDRARLADVVFGDDAARARLEAIVHPTVGARAAELIAAAPEDAVVVYDVPLLAEKGLAGAYDLVVVVEAPADVRVRRVVEARAMRAADVRARIAAQATAEQRAAVADVVLDNSGTREELEAQVGELWAEILARLS